MKKSTTAVTIAVLGAAALAGHDACATSIVVESGLGEGTTLNAGSMLDLLAGATQHEFSSSELTTVHTELAAHGIVTDNVVTFLLAETGRGLSLLTLVDDPHDAPAGGSNALDLVTTGSVNNGWYVNDRRGDAVDVQTAGGLRAIDVAFRWHENRGDGFAWTNLSMNDELTFDFTPGEMLLSGDAVQFVTWSEDGWAHLGSYGATGPFSVNFAVIPAPPATLVLAGLGLFAAGRRRRS